MEYGILPANLYALGRLPEHFDAVVQNTQRMDDPSTWVSTLNGLCGQRDYLERLLARTARTLHALRDTQTHNERVLSAHLKPRTKREQHKIDQNRKRTNKTIQTFENEEWAILNCLQTCERNIYTLEAIIYSPAMLWTSAEYYLDNSYVNSDTDSFEPGWTDEAAVSLFERHRETVLQIDEIPPEKPLPNDAEGNGKRLPPRIRPTLTPLRTSFHTTQTHFAFSPVAAEFRPGAIHLQQPITLVAKELDKLTIEGFLAVKRKRSIQMRRRSDDSTNSMLRRLLSIVRPASAPACANQGWAAPRPLPQEHPLQRGRS
ncbi:hypothetical protein BU23DRAFT_165833 [Bimuria novae-zelandiae CBS 107.79]|uniref:Uncharacterized protein n=1 Tax=Bimuria novae-zelandiae CBS 107.79 TaxID=1447943 RepID=A0A6A5V4C6_9PLEO|nr:hypothetical protein BU23DRAFT_165833 [Bimuria novae-zelandiae CBS 107.79]